MAARLAGLGPAQGPGPGGTGGRRRWRTSSLTGQLSATGLVIVVGVLVMAFWAQQYVGSVFVLALTYAVVTAGMAVQIGFSQQVAFSQSVFMGIGAYGVAALNADAGIPSLLGTLIVTIGAGIVALLLGRIVTKAPGLALAVATIMFPLIATGFVSSASYLGGTTGMPLTGNLFPSSSISASVVGNGLIVVAVVALVVLVGSRLLASDLGLELYTLGVNEHAAAAMGVATTRRKLELFVFGSMLAALGGALYAGTQLFVPATLVSITTELSLLMMLFIGGRRSVIGAVIGAFAIQYIQGASNYVSIHILLIEGILITVVLLIEPEGLAGIALRLRQAARRRRGAGAASAVVRPGATGIAAGEVPPGEVPPGEGPPGEGPPGEVSPGEGPTVSIRHDGGFATSWAAKGTSGEGGLLACEGIQMAFGGLKVLDDITLALPSRGVFGLCGPNGAGKTTLLNVLGGSLQASGGTVHLDGADITRRTPSERFRLGVCRTFQAVQLIRGRSVVDNVAVACLDSNEASLFRGIAVSHLTMARRRALEALDYLGMSAVAEVEVSSLTLERQRMVELARAVASKPRVLLLDEPASGLSESQRGELAEVLAVIGRHTCVVLVEHDLDLVASVAERIFVLAAGGLVFQGDAAAFRSSEVVSSLLMGREPEVQHGM